MSSLIQKGTNVSICNKTGLTPLYAAAVAGYVKVSLIPFFPLHLSLYSSLMSVSRLLSYCCKTEPTQTQQTLMEPCHCIRRAFEDPRRYLSCYCRMAPTQTQLTAAYQLHYVVHALERTGIIPHIYLFVICLLTR